MKAAPKTLNIALGTSNLGRVKNIRLTWEDLAKKLTTFHVTPESYADFMAMSVDQQSELKNEKGYWIAAYCEDGRRAKKAIRERSVVALDIDSAPADILDRFDLGLTGISHLSMIGHSTRKHSATKPRIRIVVQLSRPLTPDEYPIVSRALAHMLDPEMKTVDPVSFRVAQMMFLPTCSHDSDRWTMVNDGEPLDVDAVLAAWEGKELPRAASEPHDHGNRGDAPDPRTKPGLIGAFCRAYDIFRAMEELIPGIYVETDEYSEKPRYTYTLGTASSGAVVEDDGLFLYSHHGSDPCSDQLVNSWDMVRLHKFGGLDDDVPEGSPPNAWPSQKAMEEFASELPDVIAEYRSERADKFDDVTGEDEGVAPGTASAGNSGGGDGGYDSDIEDILGSGPPPSRIDRLNAKHAVAFIGGKSVILTFRETEEGRRITYSNREDMNALYANRPVPSNGRRLNEAQWWMEHRQRRTYEGGVNFYPGRELPADTFNLWGGWSVKPDGTKSCKRFLHHVLNNIVGKNRKLYDWILNFLAHMVQKPWEKPGVALVLVGDKGTGKDTFGDYVGSMFKQNHITVSQQEHVTGKFNQHQETALLLHVQEAHWAGDPKAASVLKALITDTTSMVEPKGINAFPVKSFCRWLLTSNDEKVVDATRGERRFAVFNMSDAHARDTAYFEAIYEEMKNGGSAALLHLLLNRDITGFDVRTAPITQGLTDQKRANFRNAELFWYETLYRGELPQDFTNEDSGPWATAEQTIPRGDLYRRYCQWIQTRPLWDRTTKTEDAFGRVIQKLCPERATKKKRVNGKLERVDVIPPLPVCRELFDRIMEGEFFNGDDLDVDEDDMEDLVG